jgi:hypothetical protein
MFQKVTNAENARLTAPPSVRSDCHAKRPAARSDDFATYIAMVWLMTGSFSAERTAPHTTKRRMRHVRTMPGRSAPNEAGNYGIGFLQLL